MPAHDDSSSDGPCPGVVQPSLKTAVSAGLNDSRTYVHHILDLIRYTPFRDSDYFYILTFWCYL